MQLIEGTLYVKSYRGRRGRFNVGRLVTDLGEFVVKDAILEELEEGGYRGSFGVGKLFLSTSTLPSGAAITELRARLDQVDLEDSIFLPKDAPVGVEQTDPVDEEGSREDPAKEATEGTPSVASDPESPALMNPA